MSKSFSPLIRKKPRHGSVLIGADDSFDICEEIKSAETICAAIAFGHLSGWNLLATAIGTCRATSIELLIGRGMCEQALNEIGAAKSTRQSTPASVRVNTPWGGHYYRRPPGGKIKDDRANWGTLWQRVLITGVWAAPFGIWLYRRNRQASTAASKLPSKSCT